MNTKDPLGNACKFHEGLEADRAAIRGLPLLVRLDGRAFHTLTRGLQRPFDPMFVRCMHAATAALVEDLHPVIAYTQSDEITLLFHAAKEDQTFPFSGRYQKLASVGASIATGAFNCAWMEAGLRRPRAGFATFDARAWEVPSCSDARNVFLWREADATKNSVQMQARAHFSHKALIGKSVREMRVMLGEVGAPWEALPTAYRHGVYFRRVTVEAELTEAEWAAIPLKHRPASRVVLRSRVLEVPIAPLWGCVNSVEVLFEGAPPTRAVPAEVQDAP